MTIDWEVVKSLGLPTVLVMIGTWFLVKEWWPWYKERVKQQDAIAAQRDAAEAAERTLEKTERQKDRAEYLESLRLRDETLAEGFRQFISNLELRDKKMAENMDVRNSKLVEALDRLVDVVEGRPPQPKRE